MISKMPSLSGPITTFALGLPLTISQFSGLFPFKSRTFRPSLLFGGISVTLVLAITAALTVTLSGPNTLRFDVVLLAAFKCLSIIPSLTGVYLLVMSFTVKSKLDVAISQLSLVEHRFARRKQKFSRALFIWDASFRIIIIIAQASLNYLFIASTRATIDQFVTRFFTLFVTHYLQNIYELQFLAFVQLATWWYTLCRKRLSLKTAGLLVDCHKDLSKVCRILEEAFRYQNLVDVFDNFAACTLNSFYFQATTVNMMSPLMIQLILRTTLKFYQLLVTTISVSGLYDQANQFDESLYTMMLEDDSKMLIHNEKIKDHLSRRNKVTFTGGRMFQLHSTLVHSIAALLVNYLVILVQFGGSDHKIPAN